MATAATSITAREFERLHPSSIDDRDRIQSILHRLRESGALLTRSRNRFSDVERATVVAVDPERVRLRTEDFEAHQRSQVFLNFELDGRPHFFAAPIVTWEEAGELLIEHPSVIYRAERRDRERRDERARAVTVESRSAVADGELVDSSPGGLGVRVTGRPALKHGDPVEIRFDATDRGALYGRVRNSEPERARPGWTRIGLSVSAQPAPEPLAVERRWKILTPASTQSAGPGGAQHRLPMPRTGPRVVEFANGEGEPIRAVLDQVGDPAGATAVVIPPAWGRTKETLLPLAATLMETFRAANQPVTVLRFDGVRKRGESHTDPACREPGQEYAHFTFSQGVRDIHAALAYLHADDAQAPSKTVLITFSVASIEGRKAVATAPTGQLDGWVSVVGSADAQSLTRVISGGVDFFGGIERGVSFGDQELQGLIVDMDLAGRDAIAHDMAFLEDSRRDFEAIHSPVTWIHGRDDAWMDLKRIRDVMACGDTHTRQLLEVPTGHQLRTSQEALETFQLIASEVARIALERPVAPAPPDLTWLQARRSAERARLQRAEVDLQSFWRDYLVGRNDDLGMEIVTSGTPYRSLMQTQIQALALQPNQRVLDLGAGVGAFALQLDETGWPEDLQVVAADYVREALARGRSKLAGAGRTLACVGCDLDLADGSLHVPAADDSFDAILASLLINYVSDPDRLLRECRRLLRPGGRLVFSSLKRDADTSTICVDTVAELKTGRGREALGADGERAMKTSLRNFINDAARLLDYEEQGLFHFWDAEELIARAEAAGFTEAHAVPAFGRAPQAFVLSSRKA